MEIKIETKGFDKAMRKLDDLAKRAQQLEGTHDVPATEMFTPKFMRQYTDFQSFEAMIEASGYEVRSTADFKRIPDGEWGKHVRAGTRFASWRAMQQKAGAEYVGRKLTL